MFLNYLAFLASSYRFYSISGESDIQFKYSVHQTQCFWPKAGKAATQLNGLQRHFIHVFHEVGREHFYTRSKNCEKPPLASSRPSFRPSAWNNSSPHWADFHEILYLSSFRKTVEEIQVSLKSDENKVRFTGRLNIIFSYLAQLFLE